MKQVELFIFSSNTLTFSKVVNLHQRERHNLLHPMRCREHAHYLTVARETSCLHRTWVFGRFSWTDCVRVHRTMNAFGSCVQINAVTSDQFCFFRLLYTWCGNWRIPRNFSIIQANSSVQVHSNQSLLHLITHYFISLLPLRLHAVTIS